MYLYTGYVWGGDETSVNEGRGGISTPVRWPPTNTQIFAKKKKKKVQTLGVYYALQQCGVLYIVLYVCESVRRNVPREGQDERTLFFNPIFFFIPNFIEINLFIYFEIFFFSFQFPDKLFFSSNKRVFTVLKI